MYCAYVTKIRNLRKHTNADRLMCGECFGNTVIVGMDIQPDQLGVYFPVDGRLGIEFAQKNDLLRRKDENGNPAGGYLDPEKRNITAVKLRGEKSDGLFMPLCCLDGFTDISQLREGDQITTLDGVVICEKYIPRTNHRRRGGKTSTNKKSDPIAPLFLEHADTEQLAYNLSAFRSNDLVEITLKMHGTSGRTAYLPVLQGYKFKNKLQKLLFENTYTPKWIRNKIQREPVYDWDYVTGTRRVVLGGFGGGGYYKSNAFREPHAKAFEGKLRKGETVFYEIVGFTDNGTPIMPPGNNTKIGNKEFVKKYGKTTVFSYGCRPDGGQASGNEYPQSDLYVYRMTMTNEDGDVVEYPPDFMRYRCERMGVKYVPVMYQAVIPEQIMDENDDMIDVDPGTFIKEAAERCYDGPDPVGKTHVREGVVCRIVNRPKFTAYKHKNWSFKVLSNVAVEQAEKSGALADMSEDQLSEL